MGLEWEHIADSIRLDEVLDALGIRVTSIVRGEHWASCELPTHPGADRTPSFSINEDTLLYNCFTCNAGGLLPSLVAGILELESDDQQTAFQKALEWLLPYSDGEVSDDDDEGFMEQLGRYLERAEEKPRRIRTPTFPLFNPLVLSRLDLAPLDLFEKWHIHDRRTIEHFGFRYDPERQRIKGHKEHIGPAIIIPHWFRGELVGYQERWLGDRPKWLPKYTNTEDFPRGVTLYGFDSAVEASRSGEPVTVVESAMTVARLREIGYPAVGTFGASITAAQITLLATFASGVILAVDDDPDYLNDKGEIVQGAGHRAFAENADRLTDEVPVWSLPPVAKAKGDLADLDTPSVHDLYRRKTTVFSLQMNRNGRRT